MSSVKFFGRGEFYSVFNVHVINSYVHAEGLKGKRQAVIIRDIEGAELNSGEKGRYYEMDTSQSQ